MANLKLKEEAIVLREKGESISEIAEKLGKSKGTVSYWCRNIELSPELQKKLIERRKFYGKEKFLKLAEQKRKVRLLNIEKFKKEGREDVRSISRRDLFMVGLALYWGEGYKKGDDE